MSDFANAVSAVVAQFAARADISLDNLSDVVTKVREALAPLYGIETVVARNPAVDVADSVQPDFIVCLDDGKKLKTLKRHLQTVYGVTPDEYRAKWGLPADYPMVAPNYAAHRSALAKQFGLGRKSQDTAAAAE